ncbi:myosin-7 [Podospora conica]|nr:myosin-7 [Schizothecium conicum]
MVQPGMGGLDTPRTEVGDATYLNRQPDFDMTQELSFQSPSKDQNLAHQMRHGGRPDLRTPRGTARAPFTDRRNLPAGLGGAEFTPLLKSATRNSNARGHGKENGVAATPAFLARIDEDMTPMPLGETSVYGASRNTSTYMDATPLPADGDDSSVASTPMVMRRRGAGNNKNDAKGPLEEGNQLSLREQENVIDKIEKENFGLKLKIHFLEEALRKAGPGFSEAALRENTELKVDQVTMKRDLHQYKKTLSSAEKDLEIYRQQIMELQVKAKRRVADESLRAEVDRLRGALEEKEADVEHLQRQLQDDEKLRNKVEKLEDAVTDLEADIREKDRVIGDHEDELEELKEELQRKAADKSQRVEVERLQRSLEEKEENVQDLQRQLKEEEKRRAADKSQRAEMERLQRSLEEKEANVQDLQRQLKEEEKRKASDKSQRVEMERLQRSLEEKEANVQDLQRLLKEEEKRRAADKNQRVETERLRLDAERLQRSLEEKEAEVEDLQRKLREEQKLHDKVDKLQDDIGDLEADIREKDRIITDHEDELEDLKEKTARAEEGLKKSQRRMVELEEKAQTSERLEQEAKNTIQHLEADVRRLETQLGDVKEKLQDAITDRDRAEADLDELQDEMANKSVVTKGLSRQVEEKISRLQSDLDKARQDCSTLEETSKAQRREIEDARSKLKEARLERDDSERIRQTLEAKLDEVEADLKRRTDEKALLQTRHDSLTNESTYLQREVAQLKRNIAELEGHQSEDGILSRQVKDLQATLESRQAMVEDLRKDLSTVREQLRQSQLDRQTQVEKVEALEDEVEILQSTIDEESEKAQKELERARHDSEKYRSQLQQRQQELERVRLELDRAQRECDNLKDQVESLETVAASARAMTSTTQESVKNTSESIARLKFQLADSTENLARVTKERQALQDKYTNLDVETHTLRAKLAESEAEREELEADIRHLRQHGDNALKLDQERLDLRAAKSRLDAELRRLQEQNNAEREELEAEIHRLQQRGGDDTFKLDQERLDLRTAKLRLEGELRRLRDENRLLTEQRRELEASLESEVEKASAEEERLNQEILQLQAKLRQASDGQELSNARRTIRELERKVEDYETRLAVSQYPSQGGEGNSELSLLHRDLSAARQKEMDLLQHEATQKDMIKSLKRKVADLERKAHQAALDRLVRSSSPIDDADQNAEINELRNQLATAHQTAHDLKKLLREAEQKAATSARELQSRLDEIEEQKYSLEQALDDAQAAADEAVTAHDQALKKYKQKVDKYKRERDEMAAAVRDQQHNKANHNNSVHSDMSAEERRDLHAMLRDSQITADKLDREVREQREALDELMVVELALRKKLDRARSERAAYRASAERLQKDVKTLKAEKDKAVAEAGEQLALVRQANSSSVASSSAGSVNMGAIVRAHEEERKRHEKEIRGMVMQMEWLKACWDRELKLRKDAAFAKKYLLLEVQIRDDCNKADLALLHRIRADLNPAARDKIGQQLQLTRQRTQIQAPTQQTPRDKLRGALRAVRFVVRMQIGARQWAKHERVRQRLADCYEGMEREERIGRMREQWRAGHGQGQGRQVVQQREHREQRLLEHE